MKKLILLPVLLLCFSLCACGNSLEKDLQEAREEGKWLTENLDDINKQIDRINKQIDRIDSYSK